MCVCVFKDVVICALDMRMRVIKFECELGSMLG